MLMGTNIDNIYRYTDKGAYQYGKIRSKRCSDEGVRGGGTGDDNDVAGREAHTEAYKGRCGVRQDHSISRDAGKALLDELYGGRGSLVTE